MTKKNDTLKNIYEDESRAESRHGITYIETLGKYSGWKRSEEETSEEIPRRKDGANVRKWGKNNDQPARE